MEVTYDDYLAHYGIKGMKWGIRKDRRGGRKPTASRDKREARRLMKQTYKKGTQSLSNKELERLNKRMQLEQSHKELRKKTGVLTRAGKSAAITMAAGAAGAVLMPYAKAQGKKYAGKVAKEYLLPYAKQAASNIKV